MSKCKHKFEKVSACAVARCVLCGFSGHKQEIELRQFINRHRKLLEKRNVETLNR